MLYKKALKSIENEGSEIKAGLSMNMPQIKTKPLLDKLS